MDTDLLITFVGLSVAGLAAVLGIWVERDKTKPPRYAYALSILILLATVVGMYQCYADAKQGEKLEADMARMLQMLDKISANSEVEIPELDEFVKTEIAAQSRANPAVVTKLAQRVADEGGNPQEVLATYLPPSEVEGLNRKGGLTVKPPTDGVVKPTIAMGGPRGDGSARRPRLLMKKKDDAEPPADPAVAAAAPTASAAASAEAGEAQDTPSLLPKGAVDLKGGLKPSLGAKPDGTGTAKAPAVAPKADAPKGDAAKPVVKPKL